MPVHFAQRARRYRNPWCGPARPTHILSSGRCRRNRGSVAVSAHPKIAMTEASGGGSQTFLLTATPKTEACRAYHEHVIKHE
jgi:hypothetical protein